MDGKVTPSKLMLVMIDVKRVKSGIKVVLVWA